MMPEPSFQIGAGGGKALIAVAAFVAVVLVDYVSWIYDRIKQMLSLQRSERDRT